MTTTFPAPPSARLAQETRRHMVRLLAWTRRAMTVEEIASAVGAPAGRVGAELLHLQDLGMVERVPSGFRAGPTAVVGLGGFLGRVQLDSWG